MIHKKRIGVIRGGPSDEHEVSLLSGSNILDVINDELSHKYDAHDILIGKDGIWNFDGRNTSIEDAINRIDCALLATHGSYGEDGKLQHILEIHGIPFSGSGSVASGIAMNKSLSKKILSSHNINTPRGVEISSDRVRMELPTLIHELYRTVFLPVIVKPNQSGSSVGISIVRNYPEFAAALTDAAKYGDVILIEEYIDGVEATCGVVGDFRGHELYALPVIEIRPMNKFFDYEAKYAGKSLEIVPSSFAHDLKMKIEESARKVHEILGLRHYSRIDFMIHPKKGIFVLEANTLPGFTGESLMPKALRAVGSDVGPFIEHLVGMMEINVR